MAPKTEKPQGDRVIECMAILKKLTEEVGIPADNPSIRVLKKRMGQYWRDGKTQEDVLPLHGYNRNIVYKFPHWSHQFVDLTLKVRPGVNPPRYPADLEEEVHGIVPIPALTSPEETEVHGIVPIPALTSPEETEVHGPPTDLPPPSSPEEVPQE